MSTFYKTANSFRKYQVKNNNNTFDHMCMDKGRINFGNGSIAAKEIFKLYSAGKKKMALIPHCQKQTRLLFDIDSLNGLEYQSVKSVINTLIHKIFEAPKGSKNKSIYIYLEEKNESAPKYHIRYPNIIVSMEILKKICKSLNEYFGKNIIDDDCYTLRYPGFDKFDKKTNQWLSNTAYYPLNGTSLTMDYFKQCYLYCDDLKITPLKIKEYDIKSALLSNNGSNIEIKGKRRGRHRNRNKKTHKQQTVYSEKKELVSTEMILETINNDRTLLLDINAIIVGIKKDDDVIEIKFNDTYNVNDVIYIAINVQSLRTKDERKLILYDIRSSIDRLTCSGNTKPQQLWINIRNRYIDTDNNNDDNDYKNDDKEDKENKEDKQIKRFYIKILPTAKEMELKNELFGMVRDCIVELNKEKEFNSSIWDIVKFGSFTMDIYTKTSDIDIAIHIKDIDIPTKYIQNLILESLAKWISEKSIKNIQIIKILQTANPIISIKDEIRGDIDIRIGNKYIKETQDIIIKLINKYERFGYHIKRLIIFIKYWSKKRKINNGSKGYLNSFGYTLMMIKFIQSMIQKNNDKQNIFNLYQIIYRFFSFYVIQFDNDKYCISINNVDNGDNKELLFEIKTMNKCVLQIVDPINKTKNVARMVRSTQYDKIKKELIRANTICKDYVINSKNHSNSLLLLLTR